MDNGSLKEIIYHHTYRLKKQMLAFQFATFFRTRGHILIRPWYQHEPACRWASPAKISMKKTWCSSSCVCIYIYNVYVKYICICTYDYVCLCMYKSWMLFEELNVILNMIETCFAVFFIQFRPEGMSDNYWCKSWIVRSNQWQKIRKHMGTPMRLAMVASYTRGSHGTCT